ncbi:hypothetical protein [Sphingomonas sp. NPDC079357]|uniref:hypothetical protein n=1 Tax=Sphingomonas sp. NPDC079357 TaxID=3364518 RepID=UPI00384B10D1
MSVVALPSSSPARGMLCLLPTLARGWRAARDRHACTQQRLHRLLAPHGAGMLAPVFDSLMTLFEVALGRDFMVGTEAALSTDERMLIDLLDGSRPQRACINCPEGAARALHCSICSTRIMLAMVG